MMMDGDDMMVLVKHLDQTSISISTDNHHHCLCVLCFPSQKIMLQNSKSFDELNIIGILFQPLEVITFFTCVTTLDFDLVVY